MERRRVGVREGEVLGEIMEESRAMSLDVGEDLMNIYQLMAKSLVLNIVTKT